MEEKWLPVIGFEKEYEVSNYGKIRSIDRYISKKNGVKCFRKGQLLKPQTGSTYSQVYFRVDGKQKWFYVHRLVAEAFIPNPNNLPQINHKDENKLNNFVFINPDGSVNPEKSNLEWCDTSYNINYSHLVEKMNTAKRRNFENKLKDLGLTREEYKKKRIKDYYLKNKEKFINRAKEYRRKKQS